MYRIDAERQFPQSPQDYGIPTSLPEQDLPLETLQGIKANFVAELRSAHAAYLTRGENTTSLPFLVNRFTLPREPLAPNGVPFQVLVIGGTDIVRAICIRDNGQLKIVDKHRPAPVPQVRTLDQLHQFMEAAIDPGVSAVAINIATTMQQFFDGKKMDGILRDYDDTRAIGVPELVGKPFGSVVEEHFRATRGSDFTVSVAGDGLCQVLAGRVLTSEDNIAFGVVGTGYNMGLLLSADTFVNLDAASFDKFPAGDLARFLASNQVPVGYLGKRLMEQIFINTSITYFFMHRSYQQKNYL